MTARYATSGTVGELISLIICLPALAADCETLAVPGDTPETQTYTNNNNFHAPTTTLKTLTLNIT